MHGAVECKTVLRVMTLLTLGAAFVAYSEEVDWPARILAERDAAYQTICRGELVPGGAMLVQSLRALPMRRPWLLDNAFGSIQLLLFTMEYLMDEKTVEAFNASTFRLDEYEMDRLIIATYHIYIGQETPGKTAAARDLVHLTKNEVAPLVRAGAMFTLSDPYYFYDNAEFTRSARENMARDFPRLALTREAFRLSVYDTRESGGTAMAKAVKTAGQVFLIKSLNKDKRLRKMAASDPVLMAVDAAAPYLASEDQQRVGVEILTDFARNDADWFTRYGCLRMVEHYRKVGFEPEVRATCLSLAQRAEVTPDVVRARIWMSRLTRQAWETSRDPAELTECIRWLNDLLQVSWPVNPFERNLYEDVMKAVRQGAERLGEAGRIPEAIALYKGLEAKYPNSLVASQCKLQVAALSAAPRPAE